MADHATHTGRCLAVPLAVALLAGCALPGPGLQCRGEERPAIVDSLYFGTISPAGTVSETEWQQFLTEVITPRFPEGLTAWSAAGQWKNASGELEKEASNVLHVVHADAPRFESAVREITDAYKTQFQQEAVLRVRTATCISF